MNQQPGGGGNGGFPGGSINPQALQAALGQAQQQQGQGGNAGMMGMGMGMGSMNPALLQQQHQSQPQPPNNMGGGGGQGGGGNDAGSSQQQGNSMIPAGLPPTSHVLAVLIGLDILLNALLGGRAYQTISSRIGESLRVSGWAARVPWPAWFRAHCLASVYLTEV